MARLAGAIAAVTLLGSLPAASPAPAQTLPAPAVKILDLHALIERHGSVLGPRVWPGFRPDTIPVLYRMGHAGALLVEWRHPWPPGFTALPTRSDVGITGPGEPASLEGRFAAFLFVDSSTTPGLLVGTALHEAFHGFERSVMRDGQAFGVWENAMLVGTYPVFDIENEARWALEGNRLRRALAARSAAETRRWAREFLALRVARQARLSPEYAEFERLAEMNEGLAQYALLRGLAEVAELEGGPWDARARHEAGVEAGILDSLLEVGRRSVRRRFYATGSAMALIMDRLAGDSWKDLVLGENTDLQATLARVAGVSGSDSMPAPGAGTVAELRRLRVAARHSVERLAAGRRALADSVLRRSSLVVTVRPLGLAPGALQWCGFDPQNTLTTGDGRTLHMRFLRLCAGPATSVVFEQGVVQEDSAGSYRTAVDSLALRMASGGQPVSRPLAGAQELPAFTLEAPGFRLEAARARVERAGEELVVSLLPPDRSP